MVTLQIVLEQKVVGRRSHEAACAVVRECACPPVIEKADIVLTSSGGYPLGATFYQCVKGMVCCLPVVKSGGVVIAVGGCREGIGSPSYRGVMKKCADSWKDFLRDAQDRGCVIKDQWQFQMQIRAIEHVGLENLRFITEELSAGELDGLSVNGVSVPAGEAQRCVQELVNAMRSGGATLAVVPEGPYCTPLG